MLRKALQYVGGHKLHKAAQLDNIPRMRMLIAQGADVNETGPEGATPLFFTASLGSVQAAKLLLDNGADVNRAIPEGGTALHSALLKHHADLSQFLIDNGADIHKATTAGVTPLHLAALGNLTPILGRLLRAGADIRAVTAQGQGLIYCAMAGMTLQNSDDPACLRLLFASGADPRIGSATLVENMDGFSAPALDALRTELENLAKTTRDEELRTFSTNLLSAMAGNIRSPLLGELVRSDDEDFQDWWYSAPVAVPFWNNAKIPFVYVCTPGEDAEFITAADKAVRNFLKQTDENRLALSPFLAENRHYVLGEDGPAAADIWDQVTPPGVIQVHRRHCRDMDVYLHMGMDCEWEQRSGLQLVFRRGLKLTRVSRQDGWLTDADAYDIPDSEDELLSRFSRKSSKP